jgi:hypothetical protein
MKTIWRLLEGFFLKYEKGSERTVGVFEKMNEQHSFSAPNSY